MSRPKAPQELGSSHSCPCFHAFQATRSDTRCRSRRGSASAYSLAPRAPPGLIGPMRTGRQILHHRQTSGCQFTPRNRRCRAAGFEYVAAGEVTVPNEVAMDRGTHRGELLQGLDAVESRHRPPDMTMPVACKKCIVSAVFVSIRTRSRSRLPALD